MVGLSAGAGGGAGRGCETARGEGGDEDLGRRRFVAQGFVRPLGVVVTPPLNDDPGLGERVEDLSIEQLIAKPGVEAFDEAVLPGTAPLNVGRLGPDGSDPVLHGLGDEFRSVVGSDVFGRQGVPRAAAPPSERVVTPVSSRPHHGPARSMRF